jgi:hypothetical protein
MRGESSALTLDENQTEQLGVTSMAEGGPAIEGLFPDSPASLNPVSSAKTSSRIRPEGSVADSVWRQEESECQQGESDDNGSDEVNSTRTRVTSMAEGDAASEVPPLETPCGDRPAPDAKTIPATRLEKRAEAVDYSRGKLFAQSTASHDDAITSSQNTTEEAADHSRGKSLARSTASSVDFQGHHLAGSEVVARSSAHLWSFCANLPHFLGNLSHFCF